MDILPEKTELIQLCAELQIKLTVHSKTDIDCNMIYDKLISVKTFIPGIVNVKVTPHILIILIKQQTLQELY